jgi:hypothetical protein
MRWVSLAGALGLGACGGGGGGGGTSGTASGDGPTLGDTTIPLPASAPTCELLDGYMSVQIEGEIAGGPIAVVWPRALGPIKHLSPPGPTTTIYSVGPYPRYDYPDDGLRLRWRGTSDFEGSLPLQASITSADGPLDLGNCEFESRIWRIARRSYVFELSLVRSLAAGSSSTDHCDGETQAGTLVGCLLDSH